MSEWCRIVGGTWSLETQRLGLLRLSASVSVGNPLPSVSLRFFKMGTGCCLPTESRFAGPRRTKCQCLPYLISLSPWTAHGGQASSPKVGEELLLVLLSLRSARPKEDMERSTGWRGSDCPPFLTCLTTLVRRDNFSFSIMNLLCFLIISWILVLSL